MAVKVIDRIGHSSSADFSDILQIVERNRDRIRTTANMLLSVSGIGMSATVAFTLFIYGTTTNPKPPEWIVIPFLGAILCSMTAIYFGITASFLVERHTITTKAAMLHDLLELMYYELNKVRIAFVFLMLGLSQIVIGTMLFVYFV